MTTENAKKRPVAGRRPPVANRVDDVPATPAATPREPAGSPAAEPVGRRATGIKAVGLITLMAVLGAVLMGAGAFAYNSWTPPTYSAESLVIVLSDPGSGSDVGPITAAWVEIAHAPTVLAAAADSLGVQVGELQQALTVSQPGSTPLVSISMVTTDPKRSAQWANAVAEQLLTQARRRPIAGFDLNQLTRAVPPRQADPDQGSLLLAGAAVAGALLGGVAGQSLARRRRS